MPPPQTPAAGRLGGASVVLLALAAAAPLPVVATVVPAAYAGGGLLALPLLFLGLGLLLLTFASGYTAMVRRTPHTGPLYSSVARGLGRPVGIGAAWLALLSYNALQIGLYGLVGAAAALLADWFGIGAQWWTAALACWVGVAVCGVLRVSVTAWLLAVPVTAELVVIAGYSTANLLNPAGGRLTWATLQPAAFADVSRPALGVLLVVGVLAFIGFETAPAYGKEARGPRRAVASATYLGIVLLAVLYAVASWAMSVGAAPDRIAAEAGSRGGELMFDLAAARITPWAVTLGRVLVVTGLLAALIALHHTIARYLVALGRERVLPVRTSDPRVASLTQTVLAGAVLGGFALAHLDPVTHLARWLGVGGAMGILLLLPATSLAAMLFLNRNPNGEGVWCGFFAPALSTVALSSLAYLAFVNLGALLGVPEEWFLVVPVAVLLGVGHGVVLRRTAPVVYAGVGLGGAAVVVVVAPAAPVAVVPQQREPGAHRPERVNREELTG